MTERFGDWQKYADRLHKIADEGRRTLERSTAKAAAQLVSDVKKNLVTQGQLAGAPFPPIKPATIAAKGSSKILIDSGDMLRSVSVTKQRDLEYEVSVPGNAQGNGGAIVEYARKHEFGDVDEKGRITIARPWFFPTVRAREEVLKGQIRKEMQELWK